MKARGGVPRAVRGREGFTLIELIVAVMVLAVGVLGLVGTGTMVSRQMTWGAQQVQLANLGTSTIERVRARRYTCGAGVLAGADTARSVLIANWRRYNMMMTGAQAPIESVVVVTTYKKAHGTRPIIDTLRTVIPCVAP